jgi:hypothetical protein
MHAAHLTSLLLRVRQPVQQLAHANGGATAQEYPAGHGEAATTFGAFAAAAA